MQVGLNFFPDVDESSKLPADYFAECLELVSLADELGFHHVRTVEHHFHSYGGYSPNPLTFLAAAAQRSQRVRLITGAVLPVFNNPLKLAGEIGMVDALSRGRLEVGFARGFLPHEFHRFGVDMDESRGRFDEGLAAIRSLLETEDASFEGEFVSFPPTTTLPRPTQKPTPPLWVAALTSETSFRNAGRLGLGVMANPLAATQMKHLIEIYREAWREAGHAGDGRVMLAFHMYCDTDSEVARDVARDPINSYMKSLVDAASDWTLGDASSSDYAGYDKLIAKLAEDDFEALVARRSALVGTPNDVFEGLEQFSVECGGFDIASLQVNFAGLDLERAKTSVSLFGREVLPRLQALQAIA